MTESKTPRKNEIEIYRWQNYADLACHLERLLVAAKEQIAALKATLADTETQSQRNFDSWMKEVAKRQADLRKCERIARLACVTGLHTVANSIADDIRAAFPEDFV